MRLHSDVITHADIYNATKDLPGVYATCPEHGSRSRARAFEVSLEGNGYQKNSGNRGAGDEIGATWDEWGVVIARLFAIDPEAFWGSAKHPTYANAEDFGYQTNRRFESLALPDDTHKRHRWEYAGPRTQSCKKCTAVRSFD